MYKNIKGKHGLSVTLLGNNKKTYDQLFDEFIYTTGRKIRVGCEGSWDLKMSHLSHMSIEFDAVNGSSFAFGCLSCAKLSLGVTYEKPISKYDVLKPYVELYVTYINVNGDLEEEWLKVPLGIFIVDEVKSGYLSKEITAYDYAYWYDAGDMTDFPNYNAKGGTDNNSFYFNNEKDGDNNIANTTLETVINYINNSSDFAAIKARTNNSGKIIDMDSNLLGLSNYKSLKLFDLGDNFTLRGFIGYLAGLRGRNAIFNRDGELEFRSINGNSLKTYKRSQYGSFSEDDTPMITNKLTSQYMIMKTNTADDGTKSDELTTNTISYTPGFDKINEYAFVNPLITSETQLGHVYNAIKTTGRDDNYYIPCKLSMIGDPRLDINDIITVIRRKKNTDGTRTDSPIDIPIMKMKMKLNGGCSLEIESIADSTNGQTGGLTGSISKTLEKTTSMTKGMFNELYGVDGTFGTLFANEGKIGTFVAGKITASKAEIDEIIATKASIADLAAGNLEVNAAKITNLKADKIQGGTLDLSTGISIGSNDASGIKKETLSITDKSIVMNSPKVDSDGHPLNVNQERLFIGKRDNNGSPEYVIEIFNEKGEKLWGAEGLTSDAVNSLGGESVNGEIIDSLHATKVLLSKGFEHEDTDETDTHTSLYNYLKHFNGSNVSVKDKDNNESDLQTYLDNMDERNTIVIGGNTQKFNAIEKRLSEVEKVNGEQETAISYRVKTTDVISTINTKSQTGHRVIAPDKISLSPDVTVKLSDVGYSTLSEYINSLLPTGDNIVLKNYSSVEIPNLEPSDENDTKIVTLDEYISLKTDSIESIAQSAKETADDAKIIANGKLGINNAFSNLNVSYVPEDVATFDQTLQKYIDLGRFMPNKLILSPNMAMRTTQPEMPLRGGDITLESYLDTKIEDKISDLVNTITELTNRIAELESYHTTSEPEEPDNPEQTE